MRQQVFSGWFAKRLGFLLIASVLFAYMLGAVLTRAVTLSSTTPDWAAPKAMTISKVSSTASAQSAPNLFHNLDCNLVTYRLVSSSDMQSGCFTETAFGLFDSDGAIAIFNGTDEGIPLLPHTAHQIFTPWPKAMDLIALDPISTGGMLISLYKNPVADVQDQRNLLGQLTAKQLTTAPDILLKDAAGAPLVINPQTIAFSDGGSWLVVETLGGSFVRINLATLTMSAFAQAFGSQGSPALLRSYTSVSEDGRYVAIANDEATSFRVYDLATCDGVVNNLQPQNCQSYEYRPFAQQQINGLRSIRHIRFINNGLMSFEATTANTVNDGIYELAPASSITSLTDYIGLGDSYTSGEGAFDYLTDTDSQDNMCHLSRSSYPLLLTHDLFSAIGGHSVACSGAVISDVGSTSANYRGQVRGVATLGQLQQSQPLLLESVETNFVPGYIAQHRFVKRWQPRVVTVSIGGDDVGFGNLVQNCVEPHVSRHLSDSTCYDTYEDRLELMHLVDRTIPRWTALYKQLLSETPSAQLYVIGYPQILADTGNCALNVHLNKSELEFAASLTDYLNQAIQKAAVAANIPYVDISQALAGHRLCETASYNVAVNGLTAGKDGGPFGIKMFGKESYHPNALGQSLIEQSILKQTHNLVAAVAADTPISSSAMLSVPKTGRQIYTRVPDSNLTVGVGKRGGSVQVSADGGQDGIKSGSMYTIHLDGPTGTVANTIASNSEGSISGSIIIPVSTAPGGHTIDITGENQAGEPIDITQPIYIPNSDTDSDGDGSDDITDSCPGAINSMQDNDLDGIDDTCDNLIGSPLVTSGEAGTTGSGTSSDSGGAGISLTLGTETVAAKLRAKEPRKQVLGASTIKPMTTSKPAGQAFSRPCLRMIYWLPWLLGFIILCLGLLLAEKYTQRTEFRLQ